MGQSLEWFRHYRFLTDGVVITDQNHIIIDVNEPYERITGYSRDEVCGINAGYLKSRLTPTSTYDQLKHTLRDGQAWSGVMINRKKSGQLWHSSISITPFHHDGKVYYIGIFRELETLRDGSYIPQKKLVQLRRELLRVLAISCEIRDPAIEDHLKRVQDLTQKLLWFHNDRLDLHLHEEYMAQAANSSILHDIGKAGIPEGILYKPGPLTHYERMIIETHPLIGLDIFKKISNELETDLFPHQVAKNIILYHHEKWDGTGYPHKLKRIEIPLEARIVSVVDVFDALTSRRSYKEAWSIELALAYIQEQKGISFDPEIVDSFFELKYELNSFVMEV